MNLPHLREQFHREREWPFTHENKWMAVQCTPKFNPVRTVHASDAVTVLSRLERNASLRQRCDRANLAIVQTLRAPRYGGAIDRGEDPRVHP